MKDQEIEYSKDADLQMREPDGFLNIRKQIQEFVANQGGDFEVSKVLQKMIPCDITSTQQRTKKELESGKGENLTMTTRLLMGVSQNTTRPAYGSVEESRSRGEKSAQTWFGQPKKGDMRTKTRKKENGPPVNPNSKENKEMIPEVPIRAKRKILPPREDGTSLSTCKSQILKSQEINS